MEKDTRTVYVDDFGTGKSGNKRVCDIANRSLKPAKYSRLFFRIVKEMQARNILELGTSLGITTAYLASGNKNAACITMEGAPQIAGIASETFDKLNISNVKIVVGNINENLPALIDQMESVEVVFIDANHTSEAVLRYFGECLKKVSENTVFIIDDIYWSKDMEQAWNTIKKHTAVTATIDLFDVGIVFFNADLHKKHYKMLL